MANDHRNLTQTPQNAHGHILPPGPTVKQATQAPAFHQKPQQPSNFRQVGGRRLETVQERNLLVHLAVALKNSRDHREKIAKAKAQVHQITPEAKNAELRRAALTPQGRRAMILKAAANQVAIVLPELAIPKTRTNHSLLPDQHQSGAVPRGQVVPPSGRRAPEPPLKVAVVPPGRGPGIALLPPTPTGQGRVVSPDGRAAVSTSPAMRVTKPNAEQKIADLKREYAQATGFLLTANGNSRLHEEAQQKVKEAEKNLYRAQHGERSSLGPLPTKFSQQEPEIHQLQIRLEALSLATNDPRLAEVVRKTIQGREAHDVERQLPQIAEAVLTLEKATMNRTDTQALSDRLINETAKNPERTIDRHLEMSR